MTRRPMITASRREIAQRAAAREAKVLLSVFRPPVRMTGTQWADAYRYLSPESSAVPGKFDSARAPYQREMLDAMCDPMGGRVVPHARLAAREDGARQQRDRQRMHLRPGPMLVLQPTLEMAEAWSKDRLAPMIRDTPVLRRLVKDPRSRDSGNTLLHKNFTAGISRSSARTARRASPRVRSATCSVMRSTATPRRPAPRAIRCRWPSGARRRSATRRTS
jgi:phage terminase large subunit GpA-like protein